MGDTVRVGDSVLISLNYGSDVGMSNNSAQAVVADALQQNGLVLTQYNVSQVGFFGGPATLTVRLQASDYGDKQDVASHVSGILQSQLGLSVIDPRAVAVFKGSGGSWTGVTGGAAGERGPLTIDAGPGSYIPSGPTAGGDPVYDAGVLAVVNVPIPRDTSSQSWLDGLANQLGVSKSTLELVGGGLIFLFAVAAFARR